PPSTSRAATATPTCPPAAATTTGANVLRYIGLRICMIVVLVVLSILLRDHFLDLVDFTGATAITMSSIILPLVFYLKVFWTKLPAWEKLLCMPLRTFAPSPASMA
ncbi:hypothetical protein PF006_g32583, partial [Phytophthora fragariae]